MKNHELYKNAIDNVLHYDERDHNLHTTNS